MINYGPWKIKSKNLKYSNPWIKVREDKVIRPDGDNGIFGVVEMVDGVSVLPIDKNGYVYLIEEFKYAIGEESLETISGGIDKGESPTSAAKRELKEETGIIAKSLINIGETNPFTSVIKSKSTLFIAKNLEFGNPSQEGTEKIKIVKMKFKDAYEFAMKGKISHGPSLVLILKAKEYLYQ